MPALNFQKQFADAVEAGLYDLRGEPRPERLIGVRPKFQTIRLYRKDKRDPKVGQTLYHFTAQRTKQSRRLGEAECTGVAPIRIDGPGFNGLLLGSIVGIECTPDKFARDDGFKDFAAMLDWVAKTNGFPFKGLLIRWGKDC